MCEVRFVFRFDEKRSDHRTGSVSQSQTYVIAMMHEWIILKLLLGSQQFLIILLKNYVSTCSACILTFLLLGWNISSLVIMSVDWWWKTWLMMCNNSMHISLFLIKKLSFSHGQWPCGFTWASNFTCCCVSWMSKKCL